ncbi:hypothetical protein OIU74_017117, partial [Salix koriyanagi]
MGIGSDSPPGNQPHIQFRSNFVFIWGWKPHPLLTLENDEAWALFWMESFSSNNGCCLQEFGLLARNLNEK